LGRWKPATALNRYKSLVQWFRWLLDEREIEESPMARMHPPAVPEDPPPVLREQALRRLLKACEGRTFQARRDSALIRMLVDTGMRRSELLGLTLETIDLDLGLAIVHGKGNRIRGCAFGRKTARELDRYLRARAQHKHAALPALWLAQKGTLKATGLGDIL